MSLELFINIFKEKGFEITLVENGLHFDFDDLKARFPIDETWSKSIKSFFKSKQYEFDSNSRVLTAYRSVEFQIIRIDSSFLPRPFYEFEDERKNKVIVTTASKDFSLALLSSDDNDKVIDIVKRRIQRRSERKTTRGSDRVRMRFEELFVIPHTAKYEIPRKIKKEILLEQGRGRIKACLFKMAFSINECWELRETIKSIGYSWYEEEKNLDLTIPRATYTEDLVSYYKVAQSSQFPNQAFLSYYHILEYYFLRVSDELIYGEVKSHVNSLSFNSSYDNINKLLSIVKRIDNTSDETEMLKAVLNKYVKEHDLIDFLKSLEKISNKKTFSDTKKIVFGEKATIKLEKGHALSNTAKIIKHIRNSLVHSSDRYNRENCFLPFSESESIVHEYIPVIKYLAEKVIFATAE